MKADEIYWWEVSEKNVEGCQNWKRIKENGKRRKWESEEKEEKKKKCKTKVHGGKGKRRKMERKEKWKMEGKY